MAYADRGAGGSRLASILLVVLIHIALGAGLIIGLGYEAVKKAVETTVTFDVPEDEPEEPPPPPEPEPDTPPPPPPPVSAPPPPITPPTTNTLRPVVPSEAPPTPTRMCAGVGQVPITQPCPEQKKQCPGYGSRSFPISESCPAPPEPPTAVEPRNNPGTWVRQSDYPRGPLREGIQGTVGFRVNVDANGRVSSCQVTASSGNAELDSTACEKITQRARFRPATRDGQDVPGSYASRVRFQIPD